MKTSPDYNTLPEFYKGYVSLVKDLDMMDALKSSADASNKLLVSIPESKGDYRYAEGKWSIKELIAHMIDSERVFAYRALRFARTDQTELAGFDEKTYAPEANAHSRTVLQLANELSRLRITTLDLFGSFTPEILSRTGVANRNIISVINLGYVIAGHVAHHCKVLTERYLGS